MLLTPIPHVREISPGKSDNLHPICLLHLPWLLRTVSDFILFCKLVHNLRPSMKFLFVRPELCLRLPSDPTSRWAPLPSANASHCQGAFGTFTLKSSPMPGAQKGFRVLQNPFVISLGATGFYPELFGTHTISSTIDAFLSIFSRAYINKKGFRVLQNPFVISLATTYSPTISSTIGADGFNFSVRNGKRWSPAAIVTLRF